LDIQLANGRSAVAEKPLFRRRFFLFKKKKPSVAIGSHKDGVPSTQEIEQYLMKITFQFLHDSEKLVTRIAPRYSFSFTLAEQYLMKITNLDRMPTQARHFTDKTLPLFMVFLQIKSALQRVPRFHLDGGSQPWLLNVGFDPTVPLSGGGPTPHFPSYSGDSIA